MPPPWKNVTVNQKGTKNRTFLLKVPQRIWGLYLYQNMVEGRRIRMSQHLDTTKVTVVVTENGLTVAHFVFDTKTFDVPYVWMLRRYKNGGRWVEVTFAALKQRMRKGLIF